MTDTIFGFPVPVQPTPDLTTAADVFPYDPDYSFQKTRRWEGIVNRFSPLLEQRFIVSALPIIRFSIGFDAMSGAFDEINTKFNDIFEFYCNHRGQGAPFWFFDPIVWQNYPAPAQSTNQVPYRDSPLVRVFHPGGLSGLEAGFSNTSGRYACIFDQDNLEFETFDYQLRNVKLVLRGQASFTISSTPPPGT